MVAHQVENAANAAAYKKIVIERLEEKNKTFAGDINGLRSHNLEQADQIKEM